MTKHNFPEHTEGYATPSRILNHLVPKELCEWYGKKGLKEAERIMKVAANIGSAVHELTEELDKDSAVAIKPKKVEVANCLSAYRKWIEDYDPIIVESEKPVWCDMHRVRGVYDRCLDNGTLIDIKTSSGIRPKDWLQVAWYASVCGRNVDYLAILRLDKDLAVYDYQVVENDEYYLNVFDSLRTVYSYFKKEELNGSS